MRIDVAIDDIIHITTDGFIDQFGGSSRLPFGKTRFKEMIKKYENKPTKDFEELFMKDFEEYRADSRRLDDVMILSIKI